MVIEEGQLEDSETIKGGKKERKHIHRKDLEQEEDYPEDESMGDEDKLTYRGRIGTL
jgi:hypothetical protein